MAQHNSTATPIVPKDPGPAQALPAEPTQPPLPQQPAKLDAPSVQTKS